MMIRTIRIGTAYAQGPLVGPNTVNIGTDEHPRHVTGELIPQYGER